MEDSKAEVLAQYPPELLKQLYDAGQIDEKQARLALKLKEARGIRDEAGPKGRYTGATYVAANPLEHLASGIRKYKARKGVGEMETKQDTLSQQQADARGEYRKGNDAALRGGMYQGNDVSTFGTPEQAPMGQGQAIAGPQPQAPVSIPAQQPVTQTNPSAPPNAPMPNMAGMPPDELAKIQQWLQSQQGGGMQQDPTAMYANALHNR